jgi:hypothetical protein
MMEARVRTYDVVMSQCFAPKRRYENLFDPKDTKTFWIQSFGGKLLRHSNSSKNLKIRAGDNDTPSPHRPLN